MGCSAQHPDDYSCAGCVKVRERKLEYQIETLKDVLNEQRKISRGYQEVIVEQHGILQELKEAIIVCLVRVSMPSDLKTMLENEIEKQVNYEEYEDEK